MTEVGRKKNKSLREEQARNEALCKENIEEVELPNGIRFFQCHICKVKKVFRRQARSHAVNCKKKRKVVRKAKKVIVCTVGEFDSTFTYNSAYAQYSLPVLYQYISLSMFKVS